MRPWIALLWFAVACDGASSTATPDATRPPPPCPAPTPLCAETCGNGTIDECNLPPIEGHCGFVHTTERCDGTAGDLPTCADVGFYGGTTTCEASCLAVDRSGCDACAPATACTTLPPFYIWHGGAVSGSRVALASDSEIKILEGLTPIADTTLSQVQSIVGVPGGWLVASGGPAHLVPLDLAGVAGDPKPISEQAGNTQLAYGPANRVLVVWRQPVGSVLQIMFAIADTSGVLVVPGTVLMETTGGSRISVTTDGASFFVGSNGKLARIAPDGTATVTTGFPIAQGTSEDYVTVTWSGTTGWYVGHGSTVQRFDALGVKVGTPTTTVTASDYLADGADLLALRGSPTSLSKVELIRIDASGALVGTPRELGAGNSQWKAFARIGNDIFVAWTRDGHLQAALVAP